MNKRFFAVAVVILAAALSRLLPHMNNFTPLGAIALFAGAYVANRWLAVLLPLLAMLVSDALMGFNGWAFPLQTSMVYATYALITVLGFTMQRNKSAVRVLGLSLASSVLFFVVTNFFVWMSGFYTQPALYPTNFTGLIECYVMGIPFFDKTVLSDLFYNVLLFGGFYLLQLNVPAFAMEKKSA